MDKNIKLVLDVIGILVSISGITIFFLQQKYAIGIVLIIIMLVLIYYAIILSRSQPILYYTLHYYATINDTYGHDCDARKEKLIEVKEKNITTIYDRHFSTSGKIDSFESNIGEVIQPFDEGGTLTVPTIFKSPIERSKRIKHILYHKAWDTFTNPKETLSCLVSERYREEIGLHVRFPSSRPCKEAKAFLFGGGNPLQLENPEITNGNLHLDLVIKKPRFGGKYVVEWEW